MLQISVQGNALQQPMVDRGCCDPLFAKTLKKCLRYIYVMCGSLILPKGGNIRGGSLESPPIIDSRCDWSPKSTFNLFNQPRHGSVQMGSGVYLCVRKVLGTPRHSPK